MTLLKRNKYSIVLLFLYSSLACSQVNNIPAGDFELVIGARPSVPYPAMNNFNSDLTEQGSGPSFTVPVSRHHIIPFNTLMRFYNRVAEINRLPNLRGFFGTLSYNLGLYASSNGIDCDRLGDDLINAGNLGLAQGMGLARPGGNNLALGFDTFEQFYAWLPGNIFIGPSNRSDDPHNGFEVNAHVVVGAPDFDVLARANANINLFLNNDDYSLLNSISADLSSIAKRKQIYPLNPQDWVKGSNGEYHLSGGKNSTMKQSVSDITIDDEQCNLLRPTLMGSLSSIMSNAFQQ